MTHVSRKDSPEPTRSKAEKASSGDVILRWLRHQEDVTAQFGPPYPDVTELIERRQQELNDQ